MQRLRTFHTDPFLVQYKKSRRSQRIDRRVSGNTQPSASKVFFLSECREETNPLGVDDPQIWAAHPALVITSATRASSLVINFTIVSGKRDPRAAVMRRRLLCCSVSSSHHQFFLRSTTFDGVVCSTPFLR